MVKIGKRVRDALHRDLSPVGLFCRSTRGSEEGGAGDWQPVPAHHWVHFYFEGSSACFGRMSASDGGDICPLGADGAGTTAIVPGI